MKSSNTITKILVIIPDLTTGGGEQVTSEILQELSSRGYEIRILCRLREKSYPDKWIHSFVPIDWSKKIGTILTIAQEFFAWKRGDPVLAVLTGPIIIVGLLNIFFRHRIIAYEHSDLEKLYFNGSSIRFFARRLLYYLSSKNIRQMIVVSDYLKKRMSIFLGRSTNTISVVRNPVTPFLQKASREISTQNCSGFNAFIIGRYSPEKRHEDAIELLASSSRVKRINLISRNASIVRERLTSRARSKLTIYESYSDLPTIIEKACFLLSYSQVESYSLVIAEWLASELPVITVDDNAMQILWNNCNGAHYIPVHASVHDLNRALDDILKNTCHDPRPVFKPVSINCGANDLEMAIKK